MVMTVQVEKWRRICHLTSAMKALQPGPELLILLGRVSLRPAVILQPALPTVVPAGHTAHQFPCGFTSCGWKLQSSCSSLGTEESKLGYMSLERGSRGLAKYLEDLGF